MTKESRNGGIDSFYERKNYCINCWVEFTTLTEQERINLMDRARAFRMKQEEEDLERIKNL